MADAKEIVRRVEEAWGRNDPDALDGLIAADLVSHDAPPGLPPGLAGAKAGHSIFMASFPDRKQTIEQIVGEGGRSSRSVSIEWPVVKVVEHWGLSDGLKLMMQLGAIPAPADA